MTCAGADGWRNLNCSGKVGQGGGLGSPARRRERETKEKEMEDKGLWEGEWGAATMPPPPTSPAVPPKRSRFDHSLLWVCQTQVKSGIKCQTLIDLQMTPEKMAALGGGLCGMINPALLRLHTPNHQVFLELASWWVHWNTSQGMVRIPTSSITVMSGEIYSSKYHEFST